MSTETQMELERIQQSVASAYTALAALGADMPGTQNVDNLAATIGMAKEKQHSKAWFVSVPTAVARQYTTIVTGDADVAAHCADGTAVAVVLKLTNATSNGLYTVITRNTPDGAPTGNTTYVIGRDGSINSWVGAGNGLNLTSEQESATGGNYHVLATAKGDLKVMAGSMKTNFGGADYLVVFAW